MSWVVLFVFTISILPKSYFHDILAGHTDTLIHCELQEEKKECIHPEGFNCRFDDLVVTAQYVPVQASFSLEHPAVYPSITTTYTSYILQEHYAYAVNRGPPSIVA